MPVATATDFHVEWSIWKTSLPLSFERHYKDCSWTDYLSVIVCLGQDFVNGKWVTGISILSGIESPVIIPKAAHMKCTWPERSSQGFSSGEHPMSFPFVSMPLGWSPYDLQRPFETGSGVHAMSRQHAFLPWSFVQPHHWEWFLHLWREAFQRLNALE